MGSRALPRIVAFVVAVSLVLTVAAAGAAQESDFPCAAEVAPRDGFESGGLGLTRPELAARYGPEEAGQSSWVYPFQGLDLHLTDCDLIVAFPPDGFAAAPGDEFALAASLLPADAEYIGAITLGTTIHPNRDQTASLWRSPALAARFAALGVPRGGDILIVYGYDSAGFEQGPINRIELRTVRLAE